MATSVLGVALLATTAAFAGSAGQLDQSFGRHGIVVVGGVRGSASDAAVGRHNRIVSVAGANGAFTITRMFSNGRLDKRFGDHGTVTVRFGSNAAHPTSVAIGRKGGIVIGGTVCSSRDTCDFGVARLRPNGALNRDFGGDGRVEINFPTPDALDPTVALGPNGRIIIGGSVQGSGSTGAWDIALAALRGDGSLDRQFGQGGKVVTSFAPPGEQCRRGYGFVTGMALDSHDRIVVDGDCLREGHPGVARFTRGGELDPSFGGDGLVNRKLHITTVRALALDKRDRIDVIGDRGSKFAVARLRTGGGLDRSFGKDGRAKGLWRHGRCQCVADVVAGAVDSHGRIVIGGMRTAFARFTPKGHLDRHFGHHGKVVVRKPRGDFRLLLTGDVTIDKRDRILGSGVKRNTQHSERSHPMLIRVLG